MLFPSTACLVQDEDRREPRVGLRPGRRLLGLHLRADDGGADGGVGRQQARARHRRRRDVEHHRLHRSHDLRALRRRRRRGRGRGERRRRDRHHRLRELRGRQRRRRRCACRPAAAGMPASHETVDEAAALREAGRRRRCSSSPCATWKRCAGGSSTATASSRDEIDLSCRIRPTAASSCRRPRSSACRAEKVVINIERFGNTTAGTIPLALNDAVEDGRLKRGDLVLLASVGAGFTVGARAVEVGAQGVIGTATSTDGRVEWDAAAARDAPPSADARPGAAPRGAAAGRAAARLGVRRARHVATASASIRSSAWFPASAISSRRSSPSASCGRRAISASRGSCSCG